jgi:hypothetical protein
MISIPKRRSAAVDDRAVASRSVASFCVRWPSPGRFDAAAAFSRAVPDRLRVSQGEV